MPVYKLEKRGSDKCFAQCHLANGGQSGARIYLSSFAQHFVQDSLTQDGFIQEIHVAFFSLITLRGEGGGKQQKRPQIQNWILLFDEVPNQDTRSWFYIYICKC